MQTAAADLTRILDPERVLFEREHLLTYGFDGTAALRGEAGVRRVSADDGGGGARRPLRGASTKCRSSRAAPARA